MEFGGGVQHGVESVGVGEVVFDQVDTVNGALSLSFVEGVPKTGVAAAIAATYNRDGVPLSDQLLRHGVGAETGGALRDGEVLVEVQDIHVVQRILVCRVPAWATVILSR